MSDYQKLLDKHAIGLMLTNIPDYLFWDNVIDRLRANQRPNVNWLAKYDDYSAKDLLEQFEDYRESLEDFGQALRSLRG